MYLVTKYDEIGNQELSLTNDFPFYVSDRVYEDYYFDSSNVLATKPNKKICCYLLEMRDLLVSGTISYSYVNRLAELTKELVCIEQFMGCMSGKGMVESIDKYLNNQRRNGVLVRVKEIIPR